MVWTNGKDELLPHASTATNVRVNTVERGQSPGPDDVDIVHARMTNRCRHGHGQLKRTAADVVCDDDFVGLLSSQNGGWSSE